jgi:antitoxin (DNA-binding transcriptional repressor) of toxin-antitoxin stability system
MAPMRIVGIKQLKARLSEYIRLAKAGETVLVTERDEVVAELRPSNCRTPVGERLEESLEVLAAAGEISRQPSPRGATGRGAAAVSGCPPERRRRCSTRYASSRRAIQRLLAFPGGDRGAVGDRVRLTRNS